MQLIITNQVAETNKYLRHKVKNEVKTLFDYEVKSLSQIAREVFYSYNSLYKPEDRKMLIDHGIQNARLLSILKANDYSFLSERTKTISSSTEILRVLNQIRMAGVSEYFSSSDEKRIKELRNILNEYEKCLISNNEMDEVMLYRAAIECLNSVKSLDILLASYSNAKVVENWYGDMTVLEENFLKALLDKMQKDSVSLYELYGNRSNTNSNKNISFFRAYGVFNEVAHIKDEIINNNMRLGNIAIIYPSYEYEQALMSVFDKAGIDYSFPKGFSAKDTDYIQIMLSLIDFVKSDFDCKALEAVIDNPGFILKNKKSLFRKFVNNRIGWDRNRYINYINRYRAGFIEKSEEEITDEKTQDEKNFVDFIDKVITCFSYEKSVGKIYSELRKVVNDYTDPRDIYRCCLSDAMKARERVFNISGTDSFPDSIQLISDYLNGLKCCMSERTNAVTILPFGRDEMIDRDYLFAIGLSNENIARVLMESPVLSDMEMDKCTLSKTPPAMEINKRRIDAFNRTVDMAAADFIYYSYNYYDTVSLLNCSSSLLFLEKMSDAGINESEIETVKYSIRTNGRNMSVSNVEQLSLETDNENNKYKREVQIPWKFSASSLQELLKCPLEYYYAHVLHIPTVEFLERNADRWLPANKKGDIFHHTMEKYINEAVIENGNLNFDGEIFEKHFEYEIEKAKIENPVPSEYIFEDEKEEAKNVLIKYIEDLLVTLNDTGKAVIGCEVDFKDVVYKDSGFELAFSGSVDRLDGQVDDSNILQLDIIDYKTGTLEHKLKEIAEGVQIQHYVYPYAMLSYAKDNKEKLEERFNRKIEGFAIRSVKYAFPYGEGKTEADVTDAVVASNYRLTDSIGDVLKLTVGMAQQGEESRAIEFATYCAKEKKSPDNCKYCKYVNVCRG